MNAAGIIDFHTHCFPDFLAKRAVDSVPFAGENRLSGTLQAQLDFMAQSGMRGCALAHMASRPDTMRHVNDFAVSTMGAGRFVFGSVHPAAEDAVAELHRLYDRGIRGVKFHTGHQLFDFDDPAFLPVYREIGRLGMVTLVHCGVSARSAKHLVYPRTVAKVIDAFAGAPFICAHMGGVTPRQREDFALLCSLPVYTDTALTPRMMDAPTLAEAVRQMGAARVLFGSDLPWGDFPRTLELHRAAARLAPELDWDAVLHGSAEALCARLGASVVWGTSE